jgi:undecaprenyl-phosphate 4-deoxy-4-formamido-L-arabinose transferase
LKTRGQFEIILVDDGSPDDTWEVIEQICTADPNIRGLRLSRNYGQHNALVAGIREARLPVTVTIDDDLQNPPEEIPKLLNELIARNLDVVYGVPLDVKQGLTRRLAGRITRLAMSGGLGVKQAPHVSSFRAFHTRLRNAFSASVGTNVSLDAMLTWGGSRFGSVSVPHHHRMVNKSNYTVNRLIRFAVDTITGYSTLPLQLASILGFGTALFGFFILCFVTIRPLVSGETVPGFPFLASAIAIFSGVQLITLGVMGEYISRMHFRVMQKPTYVVRQATDEFFEGGQDGHHKPNQLRP